MKVSRIKIKYLFYILYLFTLCSCTKSSVSTVPDNNTVWFDPDNYFKINFQGKTLINQGMKYMNADRGYCCLASSSSTSSGAYTTLRFVLEGDMHNLLFGQAPYNLKESQQMIVEIACTKEGYTLGNYVPKQSYYNGITDLVNKKYYEISSNGFNLNVSTADTKYIVGTFSCKLIDGSNTISANGEFKLTPLY